MVSFSIQLQEIEVMRDEIYLANYKHLDPRAFLRTRSTLWVINSDNPRAPLMKGNVLIPVRLYDFCYQKCEFEHFMGEKCLKLNLQYWENIHREKFTNNDKAPDYLGNCYINIPSIIEPDRGYYEAARKVKNFGLAYNNKLF